MTLVPRFRFACALALGSVSLVAGAAEPVSQYGDQIVRAVRPYLVSRRIVEIRALLFETQTLKQQLQLFLRGEDPSRWIEDPIARSFFLRVPRSTWLASVEESAFQEMPICRDARGIRQGMTASARGSQALCVDVEYLAGTLIGDAERMTQVLQGKVPAAVRSSLSADVWASDALRWDEDQESKLESTFGSSRAGMTRALLQGLVLSVLASRAREEVPPGFARGMAQAMRRYFPLQSLVTAPYRVTTPSLELGLDQFEVQLRDRTGGACTNFSGYFALFGFVSGDRFPGSQTRLTVGERARVSLKDILAESGRTSKRFRLMLASVRLRPLWWDDERIGELPEGLANCAVHDLSLEVYDLRGSLVTTVEGNVTLPGFSVQLDQ